SRPGERFEAVVTALDSRIDAVARTITVRARLDNTQTRFRPGTSFEAQLELRGGVHPAVREVAVLWSRDGPYVWRIRDDDTVERVFGRVIQRTEGRVLMDGGVAAGDRVVVEGVQSLRAGATVDPRPRSEAAAARGDETS
ncbi:MAG: efflux RND transporter periplasmic adaptor subunit, partial [Pseudomonadota bacterium]